MALSTAIRGWLYIRSATFDNPAFCSWTLDESPSSTLFISDYQNCSTVTVDVGPGAQPDDSRDVVFQSSDAVPQTFELRGFVSVGMIILTSSTQGLTAVVDDLQRVERELRIGMPASVRNMLDLSNLMTGRSGRS